jgi:hypothetical protein
VVIAPQIPKKHNDLAATGDHMTRWCAPVIIARYREIVGVLRLLAERDVGRHIERNTARITTTRIKLFPK